MSGNILPGITRLHNTENIYVIANGGQGTASSFQYLFSDEYAGVNMNLSGLANISSLMTSTLFADKMIMPISMYKTYSSTHKLNFMFDDLDAKVVYDINDLPKYEIVFQSTFVDADGDDNNSGGVTIGRAPNLVPFIQVGGDSAAGVIRASVDTLIDFDVCQMNISSVQFTDPNDSTSSITAFVNPTNLRLVTEDSAGSTNTVAFTSDQAFGQYYLTSNQNLTSGNTDIFFDAVQAWTDSNIFDFTPNSTNFVCKQNGLYTLEFNAVVVANGATWTTTTNKNIAIDITRPGGPPEFGILTNSANTASGVSYAQSLVGTIELQSNDIINCRIANTYSGATPFVASLSNVIDPNTFFTWKLLKRL